LKNAKPVGMEPGDERTLSPRILPFRREHWDEVRRIYAQGIATGNATFQTEPPEWEAFDAGHLSLCRWVAEAEGVILGWAALSPVSSRCVYAGVAEVSVYVAEGARGRGVGRRLLGTLIPSSEAAGLWTLQAGIFPENTGSLAIHRELGFREVGRRERLGRLAGRWRDVLLLERRSGTVGGDAPGREGPGGDDPGGDAPDVPDPPLARAFPAALSEFVECFNRGEFWESHEVLELPWRASRSEFYHGLILYTSAFVHVQRGNAHGIVAQLAKAERALEPFAPSYLGLDVEGVLQEGRDLRRRVESGGAGVRAGVGVSPGPDAGSVAFPSLELDPYLIRGDEPERAPNEPA
jgi:L-amino acid N-acyltransferase YncA